MSLNKGSKEYTCFMDCKQGGCPGHTLELTYQDTVEVAEIFIDGKRVWLADCAELKVACQLASEMRVIGFN